MIQSIKKLLYGFYLEINKRLDVTEKWYTGNAKGEKLPYRPIFILGAPRCGSTLLYQSMATAFDVNFISNAHCFLHGAPWVVEALVHPASDFRSSAYRSKYGSVKGPSSPSECGNFWYRFFPRDPQYVTLEDVDPGKLASLRTSIRALMKASSKPLLIKNLVCGLRLQILLHTLPEAVYIVLNRKEVDIAHSILESRKNLLGTYDRWFSLEPPNIDELKTQPVVQQVVEQIRSTYKLISDAENENPSHFHHLSYESFCSDPVAELQGIHIFFSDHNMHLPISGPLPEPFERRNEIRIDKQLYNDLLHYIEK